MNQLEKEATQERIVDLLKQKKHEEVVTLCLRMLNEDPSEPTALFQLAKVMIDQGNKGLAYNLMARATKLRPDIPENWVQFAQCHPEDADNWKKAEWCFKKGLKIAEQAGKKMPMAMSCLGTLAYLQGKYDEAIKWLDQCLEIQPDSNHAASTMAFTYLALCKWDDAWNYYDTMLKTGGREHYGYGDEPDWDGTPGKRLIISGEQGIGDELMYASCFNEVIEDNEHVVIECMPRLEKLFKRSFPKAAAVYGSRWEKSVVWEQDHKPDAHLPMASLPRFYRTRDEHFHGKPYLVPDPDMVDAVQGIFSKMGRRPKVGIAWTGGTLKTRGHLRERTLDELLPILRVPGIDWISLEYYDKSEELATFHGKRGIPIHVFNWLTARGLDYDLTAALISQLDLVISVPTTTVQAAGGLGVPCWVIVPRYTGWMFAQNKYPWAASVIPYRNPPMREIEEKLRGWVTNWHSTRTAA